jgi:signal transduction histidine kinase
VARIEATARELLSRTRGVVVTLASGAGLPVAPAPLPAADRPIVPAPRDRSAVLPWTSLAAATMCVGLLVEVNGIAVRVAGPIAVAACLAVATPLAVVWAAPLTATVVLWAAAAGFAAFVHPLAGMFAPIGLVFLPAFFVAALSDRWRSAAGLAVCCLGLLAAFGPAEFAGDVPLLLLSWGAGRVLADRVRLVAELRATTALLADRRETALREAVLEERARVAREVHDAVGHRLTVLALHATAARRLWASDRPRAESALDTIAEVAGAALEELRRSVTVSEPDAPVPLAAVADLVAGARAAGLTVTLAVDDVTAVHPAAYRLVQEALTNVLRHAPGAAADVALRIRGDRLEVDVQNSPPRASGAADPHGGSGLLGLQRRVEQCGGRLSWGPGPDGGFAVAAEFPVPVPA